MSANSKNANSRKMLNSTAALILLGMAALYGGSKWLFLLIPAALLVRHTARPLIRTGRN